MKKLSIIVATMTVLFSFQTLSAQQTEEITQKTEVATQDSYKKIGAQKVSEIIKAAVEKDFPGASITEAYIDENKNYKLVLTIDNKTKTVYTNPREEWFDPNEKG